MDRFVTLVAGERLNRTEMIVKATALKAGMPATITHPSDRYAAVIAGVSRTGASLYVLLQAEVEASKTEANAPLRPRKFTWRKGEQGVGYFAELGCSSPFLIIGHAENSRPQEA